MTWKCVTHGVTITHTCVTENSIPILRSTFKDALKNQIVYGKKFVDKGDLFQISTISTSYVSLCYSTF